VRTPADNRFVSFITLGHAPSDFEQLVAARMPDGGALNQRSKGDAELALGFAIVRRGVRRCRKRQVPYTDGASLSANERGNETRVAYEPLLHVVLFQPEIPQNTGNIGRTCVAARAKLWLVRPLGFRLDASRLKRAGLDYWQYLEWEAVDDWPQLVERLNASRFRYFTKTAEQTYNSVRYARGDVLVFGSESRGLPASVLGESPERCVRIPMHPEARSLNLAAAAAIAIYRALADISAPDAG
jgi:tRNA (cytidine/uridine-2'-O-)-methyltransferase